MSVLTTPHFGLKKPDGSEAIKPDSFNANADLIDEQLHINSVLTGTAAPTTSTAGAVGQFYLDTAAKILYQCMTQGPVYTWKSVSREWKLLQAYTTAGSYTFTTPSGITELGAFVIGGGGSGAVVIGSGYNSNSSTVYSGAASGGASGYVRTVFKNAINGTQYPVVVGSGGTAVTITGSVGSNNGNNGNSSSFAGETVSGGSGGKVHIASGASDDCVDGALGGQSSDAVYRYNSFAANYGKAIAPKMGESSFVLSTSSVFSRTIGCAALNPFDGKRYLAAGGSLGILANSWYNSSTKQSTAPIDDGTHAGDAGLACTLDAPGTALGTSATGYGNGGGAAGVAEAYTGGAHSHTATSGAGSTGAVLIYGR